MKEITVLGIGGSSFSRIDLAKSCGYKVCALYHYNDERTGELDHGYTIKGSFNDLLKEDIKGRCFLLSMGDMIIRQEMYQIIVNAGGVVPTLIHPSAEISEFASVSPNGVIIDSQSIVQSDCIISDGCFICSQAMVCHQTTVDPYVFIATKAIVGARIRVHEFAFIGQNATVISTKVKTIGKHAIIGAGSVVTEPVNENTVVAGNPAKILKILTGGG